MGSKTIPKESQKSKFYIPTAVFIPYLGEVFAKTGDHSVTADDFERLIDLRNLLGGSGNHADRGRDHAELHSLLIADGLQHSINISSLPLGERFKLCQREACGFAAAIFERLRDVFRDRSVGAIEHHGVVSQFLERLGAALEERADLHEIRLREIAAAGNDTVFHEIGETAVVRFLHARQAS